MRAPWPWLILLLLGLSPWLLLAGLGGWQLWQNDKLLDWVGLAMAFSGTAWIVGRRLRKHDASPFSELPQFEPDRLWSPADEAAWAKVEKMAQSLDPAEYSLGDSDKLLTLSHRIIIEVAKHFHPGAKHAELGASLPGILLIVEKVSRDMRALLIDQVPASHLITIEDGLVLWRWRKQLGQLGTIAGLGRMLANPAGGALRMAFFGHVTRYPMAELERWLLHTLARKIGYYAILLYGGQTRLDEAGAEKPTAVSARDLETAAHQADRPAEPLRILVAGQTKAGKSSLINALFGELRAPTDALPSTYALTPYRLEKEGEFLALVFDSPGYGDLLSWIEANQEELRLIDLVLLACSATHAGRAADERFLQTLHEHFAMTPDRIAPPVIVALTHIDLLRPAREWNPPYNVAEPADKKESQIRACMEEVARSLVIPLERIQAVCLKPGEEWNIEAVWTSIAAQLPQARRAQYLRCLKDARAREKWELILRQLGNSGRLIVRGIRKVLPGK